MAAFLLLTTEEEEVLPIFCMLPTSLERELNAILQDHLWGLSQPDPVTVLQRVPVLLLQLRLLEGYDLVISLDDRGFQILESSSASPLPICENSFETLESLLMAVSPLYVQRHTERLTERLTSLIGNTDGDEQGIY